MIQYIDTNAELKDLVAKMNTSDSVAIDLEFDKNHYRYGFNLCLMQLQLGPTSYLVDPLAGDVDISTIFPPLENPDIEKICFAFGEDIRLLHLLGCHPRNILDLSVVASLVDYPPMSHTNLLDEALGVKLGKSAQMSNWFNRPLTQNQKEYAADDVIYLHDLRDKLIADAEKKDIMEWVEQEKKQWEETDYSDVDTNDFLKDRDKKGLSELQWHIFSKMMEFREALAERKNRPGYKIIDKTFLLTVAKQPSHIKSWMQAKGMHPGLKNTQTADEAIAIVDEAVEEARKKGLSDTRPAEKPLSKDKLASIRKNKAIMQMVKRECFNPVKAVMAQDYGENAANYIVNNRLIDAYIQGNEKEIIEYRRDIIEYTAMSLGMDVYGAIDEAGQGL